MPEKVYIRDEYFAAARALRVPLAAKPDEIEKAYQERLKECIDDPRRKEELLHAKNILTGSLPTMEELTRYSTWRSKQLKGPDHSGRQPTIFERAFIASAAATRKLLSFAAPFLEKQFRDPSEIGGSNRTISERVEANLKNGSPTRSIWTYLGPGGRGEKRPGNVKGPRR